MLMESWWACQEAALAGAGEADPLAREIGAANTLVRGPGGAFTAYNTDCSAAISSIERALGGGPHPLQGKEVVVIGAGGAGRALAFGAAAKGARVAIANRSRQRAEDLAAAIPGGARVLDLDQVTFPLPAKEPLAETDPHLCVMCACFDFHQAVACEQLRGTGGGGAG